MLSFLVNPQLEVPKIPDPVEVFLIPGKNHCAELAGREGYKNIMREPRQPCLLKTMAESKLLENPGSFEPNLLVRRDHSIQSVKGAVKSFQSSDRESIFSACIKLRKDNAAHIE